MKFYEQKLANGLQVIAELNPNVHSVALGFFVRTGARDETPEVNGVSHFLEHMVFKGTEKYSADDVNRVFDEIGAKYNASTSEEVTLFYGAVLPEYLPPVFELLSSILFPSLRTEDFDMEKKVILEEIGMYDDQPTFVAYDKVMQTHFANHPLGQSILGTVESVTALTAEQMRDYHRRQYKAGNIVLAVAGNVEWPQILELAQLHCGQWPAGRTDRPTTEARPTGGLSVIVKETSLQEQVMQLGPAPSARSPLRFAAELLSVVVGDDSNSRMYWDIVDPGHAEAAELGYNEYDGSGVWLTYLSCSPETTDENLARIQFIYDSVNRDGVSEAELAQAKNKVASRVVLRGERPMGRLSSLGNNWIYREEYRSIEDDLNILASITTADIRAMLDAYPIRQVTTAAVGPLAALGEAAVPS